jgi:hypothetical protein
MKCGSGATQNIYSLSSTSAYNAVPVLQLSGLPVGGYSLGLQSLGGAPIRAWWNWPTDAPSGSALQPGGTGGASQPVPYYGAVWSTDQGGTTPQRLILPLHYVAHSAIIRDGIVASDGDRIVFTNGRSIRDLGIFSNRVPNSDYTYKVLGFYIQEGQELFAEVNRLHATTTIRSVEHYNWTLNTWTQVSSNYNTAGANYQSYQTGGSLPISTATRYLHNRVSYGSGGSWLRQYQPPASTNPYALRKTTGAAAGTGIAYEASAVLTTPYEEIPGLEGWVKVIRRVVFKGNVDAGGTGGTPANIKITGPGIDTSAHTLGNFVTGNEFETQVREFEDNEFGFYLLQLVATSTQQSGGTDPTHFTTNLVPLVVEGFAFRRPLQTPAFRIESDI